MVQAAQARDARVSDDAGTALPRHATPLLIGMVMAVALFVRLLSALFRPRVGGVDVDGSSVVGCPPREVMLRLGAPSAVTEGEQNVWYYRSKTRNKRVLAVTFENGIASSVQTIHSPI